MSDYNTLKSDFNAVYDGLLPIVKEAFSQLFQKEMDATSQVQDELPLSDLVGTEAFPVVAVAFDTAGAKGYHHLITFEPSLGNKLYAWMIAAEEEGELGDEEIEGIMEASNQIFGQLQMSTDGEPYAFKAENVKVALANSPESVGAEAPLDGGLSVVYTLTIGEESFTINHYFWVNDAFSPSVEDDSADMMAGFDDLFDGANGDEEPVGVQPAQFGSLPAGGGGQAPRNIDMLMDVELQVLVELGKKTMRIEDILKLGKGSVVELNKNAGEPLEIYVNNRKLAEGEVVVVDDHFGIRITALASQNERIKSLG